LIAYSHDASIKAFGDLTKFSQLLLGITFNKGLLLRGAITKGEVFVDGHILIGEPIVRAYHMQQEQEWVGCWMQDKCIDTLSPEHKAAAVDYSQVFHYPIPLKTGAMQPRWALNWAWATSASLDDCDFEAKIDAAFLNLCERGSLSWPVARKRDNTKAFLKHALTHMYRTQS